MKKKKIEGELVFIDDVKLKIKTEISTFVFVANKIDNVLSYEIINNKQQRNTEEKWLLNKQI